jgi:hypothetical protein
VVGTPWSAVLIAVLWTGAISAYAVEMLVSPHEATVLFGFSLLLDSGDAVCQVVDLLHRAARVSGGNSDTWSVPPSTLMSERRFRLHGY